MDDKKTIFKKIEDYAKSKGFNLKRIQDAYKFADISHKGQKRKSGEEYIIHPLTVALYLTDYNPDEKSIITALLHDCIEDSETDVKDIREKFGNEVAKLVEGMTKFSRTRFRDAETLDRQTESLRKWFSIMHDDIRVAVIKLVDRVHNMETLSAHNNPKKEFRIAQETLDVFVKIADRLGIERLKEKLEDFALRHIDPKAHKSLSIIRKKEEIEGNKILKDIARQIQGIDTEKKASNIQVELPSFIRMRENEIQLKEEMEGALPLIFSITTKDMEDCYHVLYLIHSLWKVQRGSFKDYINWPLSNGHRALHTSIIYEKGRHILFKIRTEEMEKYYNNGVTSFCFSGEKDGQKLLGWLKYLPHVTKSDKLHSKNFFNQLKHDILEKSITVHTDKDQSLLLPSNSTALDAAFYTHGRQSIYLSHVHINGARKSLSDTLKQNDTILFHFTKEKQLKYEWLNYVETAMAVNIICEELQKEDRGSKLILGKAILSEEMQKEGKGYIEEIHKDVLSNIQAKYRVEDIDELHIKIAEGSIDSTLLAKNLYEREEIETIPKHILYFKGTLEAMKEFIHTIPHAIRENGNFLLNGTSKKSNLKLILNNISYQHWRHFSNYIHRQREVELIEIVNSSQKIKTIIASIFMVLLWGIEPVLVYSTYSTTDIKPSELIFMRYWFMTIPFVFWMMYRLMKRRNIFIQTFRPRFMATVLIFLGVVYFRYFSLEVSLPSQHMVLYRYYMVLLLMYLVFVSQTRNNMHKKIGAMVLSTLGIGLLLFFTPLWPWYYKLLSIFATVCFTLFSINNHTFQKQNSIHMRYYQYITMIYLYGTLLVTAFSFLYTDLTLSRVKELLFHHSGVIALISYSVFIPYILSYYFNINYRYKGIALLISGAWIITLIGEVFILKIPIQFITIVSGIIVMLGTYFLADESNARKVAQQINED